MARATSKEDAKKDGVASYEKMMDLIASLTLEQRESEFVFEDRDKNIKDVLIHLYEWHQLLLRWVSSNMNGEPKPFLPEPYNWKTYPKMNIEFTLKHKDTSLDDATALLKESHKDILELLDTLDNEALFTKRYFDWTADATLGSYFVSTLSSHYEWAMKKIRKHKKLLAL